MNTNAADKLKGTLAVLLGLFCALAPYSLLMGWNLITLLVFWFLITPALAIWLPTLVTRRDGRMFASLAGLLIFYAFMVFMIYDHYKSDYFRIMMVSCVVNLISVAISTYPKGLVTGHWPGKQIDNQACDK